MAQNDLQYGITRSGRPSGGAVPLRRPKRTWTRIRRGLGKRQVVSGCAATLTPSQTTGKPTIWGYSNHYLRLWHVHSFLWRVLLTFLHQITSASYNLSWRSDGEPNAKGCSQRHLVSPTNVSCSLSILVAPKNTIFVPISAILALKMAMLHLKVPFLWPKVPFQR